MDKSRSKINQYKDGKNTVYETIVFIRIRLIKLLLVGFRPFDPKPFILQPLGRQSLKDVWW